MIRFSANTRRAKASTTDAITQYSRGIPIHIDLSEDFDGLQTTIVFRNKTAAVDLLYSGSDIVLPHEITEILGTVFIGVYAANPDGTIVIPTVWASVTTVVKGVEPSGIDPEAPTPSWAAQVQEISNEALENSENAVATANRAYDIAVESAESAATSAYLAKQYEEAAEAAKVDAEAADAKARDSAADAARSEANAEDAAARAEQSAAQSGYMFFYIDEHGHIIYQKTTNVLVDFYLHEGDLYVKAVG